MTLKLVMQWSAILLLVGLIWSLLVGLYIDLSQPVNTARVYSTTVFDDDMFSSALANDAARFHEFALLSAAVYDGVEYHALDTVSKYPQLQGLWKLVLNQHTSSMIDKSKAEKVRSLSYQVYKRRDLSMDGKLVYAIVFRGTDRLKDFFSNFRWFLKLLPVNDDQYDFVRKNIAEVIEQIYLDAKNHGSEVEVVAAGHSLGGGLAHQAAYASDSIRTVYTFMSTSVTGYYDVEKQARKRRAEGMRLFRIHETGEILAALRRTMKSLFPVSQMNPTIVEVRYNFQNYRFNPIKLHSIALLAKHLTEARFERTR